MGVSRRAFRATAISALNHGGSQPCQLAADEGLRVRDGFGASGSACAAEAETPGMVCTSSAIWRTCASIADQPFADRGEIGAARQVERREIALHDAAHRALRRRRGAGRTAPIRLDEFFLLHRLVGEGIERSSPTRPACRARRSPDRCFSCPPSSSRSPCVALHGAHSLQLTRRLRWNARAEKSNSSPSGDSAPQPCD